MKPGAPFVCVPALLRTALFATVFFLPIALAASEHSTPTGPPSEPAALIAVIPKNFPPIFAGSENQLPTGFGVEFMELVAEHAGLKIHYRVLPDWEAVFAALRNGEADLIPNTGITEERQGEMAFTQAFAKFTLRLFVRDEDRGHIASLDDIAQRNGRIAVVTNNIGKTLMEQRANITTQTYASLADAFVALRTGEVDGLVFPAEVAWYLGRRLGIDSRIEAVGPPLMEIARGIAVRKDRTELLETFNRVIPVAMRTPDFELMQQRWFPRPEPWWTWRHTLVLLAGLGLASVAAAVAMRFLGLRHANARLRQTMSLNQAILDVTWDAVMTVDADGIIHSANQSAVRMLRHTSAELTGHSICAVLGLPDQQDSCTRAGFSGFYTQMTAAAGNSNEAVEMIARRDQETFPVRARVAQLPHFTPPLLVLMLQDISAQRQAEDYARYLTDHDPLTGLFNQQGALLVMDNILERAARTGSPVCCAMLGLDRFAHFNEVYGRTAGDALLSSVARLLSNAVRQSDVVGHPRESFGESLLARAGGNRFLLIFSDADIRGGRIACERILNGLRNLSVDSAGASARCDAHIGLACYPRHGSSAAELISHAEIALLAAREDRVHSITEFSQDLHTVHHEENRRVQRLFDAFDQHGFVLHFQPVLNLLDGSVRHFEALVRIDPGHGGDLVPPGEFIPTAERHGLIARIDYAVLRLAFTHLAGTNPEDDFVLAVNLSAAHFGDHELLVWLEKMFAENVVLPQQLVFEITETAALHNIAMARDFMEPLRALGCRFALDDFGVGFSSFEYLRLLPVDYVKIDGSFIRNMPDNPEDLAIARAITDVAHATGRQVIAEFVESQVHLDMLIEMGVDFAQGYHIGRPVADPPHARPGKQRS